MRIMDLRDARRLAKLTRGELDELAGLSMNTVRDIETGANANPSWKVVAKITDTLRTRGRALQIAELRSLKEADLFPVETTGVR